MEKETRKRAKAMLEDIQKLINLRALSEPNKDRETLADELINEIKEKYPKEVPPAWETVIKRISATRNHEPSPLEKPWHLGTLESHPIQAEAIPAIFYVQNWAEKMKQKQSLNKNDTWLLFNKFDITIRQVCSIAWLYTFIDWNNAKKNKNHLKVHYIGFGHGQRSTHLKA